MCLELSQIVVLSGIEVKWNELFSLVTLANVHGKNETSILRGYCISHLLVQKWCVTSPKLRGIQQ